MATFDLIVVGAGIHGLIMAKTYLEVHPDAQIMVVDSQASIGGVWAQERLYSGLKSNNMIGTYEFSDFPMVPADWGLKRGDFIPGQVMHDYLEAFARRFKVMETCRLNTRVVSAAMKDDNNWAVDLKATHDGKTERLTTRNFVIAEGLTSDPNVPDIEGNTSFPGPQIHSRDLAWRTDQLKPCANIAIIGGSKSAYDSVNLCCTNTSAQVHWIIRESGHGTNWITTPYVTPLKQWLEKLLTIRFLTWFSPNIWSWADNHPWPHWFLQQTRLGRQICSGFWWVLNDDATTLTGYDKHPETAKLKPRNSIYWTAGALSILNYDTDIFSWIRNGRAKVHVSDVKRISPTGIILAKNNAQIPADAIIYCTGWRHTDSIAITPSIPPFPPSLLATSAQSVLESLPYLNRRPTHAPPAPSTTTTTQTPLLYRLMLPPSPPALLQAHNHAHIGQHLTVSTALVAQTQALWLTAYLDGHLPHLHPLSSGNNDAAALLKEIQTDAARTTAYMRLRHPPEASGYGDKFGDMAFESLNYIDVLLRDLGLDCARKRGGLLGWWKDVFVSYGQGDYVGLVREWIGLESLRMGRGKGEGGEVK